MPRQTVSASDRFYVAVVARCSVADVRAAVGLPDAIYGGCDGFEIQCSIVDALPTRMWDRGQRAFHIRDHVHVSNRAAMTTVYFGQDGSERLFSALGDSALTVKVGGTPVTAAACRVENAETGHQVLSILAPQIVQCDLCDHIGGLRPGRARAERRRA